MKDALVGSRFQCSLERGTLQLPSLQAVSGSGCIQCPSGIVRKSTTSHGIIFFHGMSSQAVQWCDVLQMCPCHAAVFALQVPLILVCPGTGLSPCRALVQARHQQLMSTKTLPARFQEGLQAHASVFVSIVLLAVCYCIISTHIDR